MKEIYEQKWDERLEQNKIWRDNHPEEMKHYKKKWRENNREYGREYAQEYSKNHKEEKKENMSCECGSVVRKADFRRHERTQKHQEYLQSLNDYIIILSFNTITN